VKYETSVVNSSKDKGKPLFYESDPSDLDLITSMSIWVMSLSRPISMGNMNRKHVYIIFTTDPCDLDL